jgi:DNA polymerase
MRPGAADFIVVDFETAMDQSAGYTLTKMSTRAYVDDPRFEILMVAIGAGDSDDIDVYFDNAGEGGALADARRVLEDAAREGRGLASHNVMFDGLILRRRWGIEFQRYFDTTSPVRYLGYAASLANAAKLVKRTKLEPPPFTRETLRDPTTAERLAGYNANDVSIARALLRGAIGNPRFTDLELAVVDMTCRANLAGLAIDLGRARSLVGLYASRRDEALAKLATGTPSFDTNAINSAEKVKAFVSREFGLQLESLDKRDHLYVEAMSRGDALGRFLELRDRVLTWGRQTKKLEVIANGCDRVFGPMNYYGAHTGRFSGGGKDAERINVQNLNKGGKADFDELKYVRTVIVPDPGESFVSCDLSTIEPRVLAFLAGQANMLERFRAGDDLYTWFISPLFPGKEIVKGGEHDHLRQLGKQSVLGLGYLLGKTGFHQRLRAEGLAADEDLVVRLHGHYHATFPRIRQLAGELWSRFVAACDSGTPGTAGRCVFRRFTGDPGITVEVKLPTDRCLYYRSVEKRLEHNPFRHRLERVYRYVDFYSFDAAAKQSRGGPGKKAVKCADGRIRSMISQPTLIENIVQAVARDLLVAQMREIEQRGLRMRFSVHDEGVYACAACGCPNRDSPRLKGMPIAANHMPDCPWIAARGTVYQMMSQVPASLPGLAGLPVACELSDSVRDAYGK